MVFVFQVIAAEGEQKASRALREASEVSEGFLILLVLLMLMLMLMLMFLMLLLMLIAVVLVDARCRYGGWRRRAIVGERSDNSD